MTSLNESYVFIQNNELFLNMSPNSMLNNHIVKSNHINTNRNYREYLQQNALTIQDANFRKPLDQPLGNTIPYAFNSVGDSSKPRGYENSIPKQHFLSQQNVIANQTRPMFNTFIIEKV